MNRIAEEVERDNLYWTIIKAQQAEPEATGVRRDRRCGQRASRRRSASPPSRPGRFSGATALRLARERPDFDHSGA